MVIVLSLVSPLSLKAETADIVFHGGSILTMNDDQPFAEAIAVKDGRILSVGKESDVFKP